MAPLAQMPAGHITWTALTFVLRTARGDPLRLAPAVRREIWAINPNIVIPEIATMDARVAGRSAPSVTAHSCSGCLRSPRW